MSVILNHIKIMYFYILDNRNPAKIRIVNGRFELYDLKDAWWRFTVKK